MNEYAFTNRLINETSPYLLQHAHNPVNWFAWGEDALKKAQKENKLLVISVGYAACHWCHVMEHESFEDKQVADVMNNCFVSIKVDREERPDIDNIYMQAAQLLTGRGGWPLNVIALPDGRPVYAGTYFSQAAWLSILNQISELYKNKPEKLYKQAELLSEGLQTDELLAVSQDYKDITRDVLDSVHDVMMPKLDFESGGQNGAPKFPMPVGLRFMLHYGDVFHSERALKWVDVTLKNMAQGGIYDQLGGGFARYSTDANWRVPHFEKMLYDNGQLLSLYSRAWQKSKSPAFKKVVYDIHDFMIREMTSPEGGFYSSIDADSEGEEGTFYSWTAKEIKSLLGRDATWFMEYYNITEEGNWEQGKNILYQSKSHHTFFKELHLSDVSMRKKLYKMRETLFKARSKRERPGLDTKILTSWNGLMITGLIDAYKAFHEIKFLNSALSAVTFVEKNMLNTDGRLNRALRRGNTPINGFLDDYAFIIEAYITLYQATFDESWLHKARQLVEYTFDHFYDNTSGMFFYTSDRDPDLIVRKMETDDNVIPSSNSAMAHNLYLLGLYYHNSDYHDRSKTMLLKVKPMLVKGGVYYANWNRLAIRFVSSHYEVAIVGNEALKKRQEFERYYLPNVILSGSVKESDLPLLKGKGHNGTTNIYVCQNKTCLPPVHSTATAIDRIKIE
ncbi:MAG: thioredoxin domain-containing protein [Fibrobacteria bacterium]|nr:thioredoxin domain-containing protein [Fibrobacteria bacterium]